MTTPKLQHELKKKRPFESPQEEAALNIVRTSDQLQIRFARLLREYGLTSPTQYNILRILRGAGEKGLACREIGCRLITRDPDITRLLDRLESRGLIARSRETQDRRVVKTRITTEGLRLSKELDQPVQDFHRRQFRHFPAKQLRQFLNLLDRARELVEEAHSPD